MTQAQEDRAGDPATDLEDLFNDAMLAQAARNPKRAKVADPGLRHALDAAAKKMRELYTLPENWTRTRGVALIDRASQILVGNFSEYTHNTVPGTRKLIREHLPISIDATEVCDGYLGEQMSMRLHGRSWTEHHLLSVDVWLDGLMVGAPGVKLSVCTRLGVIVEVHLEEDVQMASANGGSILRLPAGTDIFYHLSTDTKTAVRKELE